MIKSAIQNRTVKILLEDGFSVGKGTGIGRYTQNIAAELRKRPDFQLLDAPQPFFKGMRPAGARRLIYSAWLENGFQKRLVKLDPDVVHFTNYLIPRARKSRAKYAATIHDLVAWRMPEAIPPIYGRYIRWVIKHIVDTADLILCPSRAIQREVIDRFGLDSNRVRAASMGAFARPVIAAERESELAAGVRTKLGLKGEFLLFVGTIEQRKNVATLVEAFSRIAERLDLKLVIVGRPGYGAEKVEAAIARLPGRDRCIVTGFLSDEELAVLYKIAGLFVYPSIYEGFGTPLIEAMSSALPIVASRIPSTEEVAGDAAAYYGDPMDACALAELIEKVLGNPNLRQELAARGRERSADFISRDIIEQYADAYRSVLA